MLLTATSEMDRLDYINSQDAVVAQVQSAFAAYNQVKKTIPLMEKSVELQELSMQLIQKRQQLGQATQIDVLNAQKSLQSLQSTLTQTKAGLQAQHQQLCVQTDGPMTRNRISRICRRRISPGSRR